MKTTINPMLGRRIRDLRKKKGLTQEILSESAGIHYTFLGHIERNTKLPSLETLGAIAKALAVKPSSLIEGIRDFRGAN